MLKIESIFALVSAFTLGASVGEMFTAQTNQKRSLDPSLKQPILASMPKEDTRRTWSLSADFDAKANDNSPWSYGWMSGLPNPSHFVAFPMYTSNQASGAIVASVPGGTITIPNAMKNEGTDTKWGDDYLPSGQVVMNPGASGEEATVRFRAPKAGHYTFKYHFAPLNDGAKGTTSEAIIVVKNLAWERHSIRKNRPWMHTADFELFAGETISFVVTHGKDGFDSDATGLTLDVTRR